MKQQRDLRNISKVNETCYCEHVIIRLKCGKRMRIHGTDMGIKCGTVMDEMRHFNEFFASYLRFCVLDLCSFFVMEYNVVVLIIHNISYTAIFSSCH